MRTLILTSSCLIFLISSSVLGADEELACMNELAKVESLLDERVKAKALSEDTIDEINLLLDEADESCSKRRRKSATDSLDEAKKLLVTKPQ